MADQLEVSRKEIVECIEHFKGMPVTNTVLQEYCNLNHIGAITEGTYQDFVFQYNHDRRMEILIPKIMAALSKYQSVPELIEDSKRTAIIEANDHIGVDICKLMEDEGILYQEIDLVAETFGGILKSILTDAGKRANNMAATMLAHTAREKYGDPLTLKVLGEAYRSIAKEKGVKAGL